MHVSPLFIHQLYEFLSILTSEMIILVEKINLPAGRNKAFFTCIKKEYDPFHYIIFVYTPYSIRIRTPPPKHP